MEKFARLRFHRPVAVAFCAVASCALAGTAAAQTVIPSVPFTISAPGVYVLEKDLVTNRPETSIVVNANNVTIDFQGHSITSTRGASSLNAHGIYAKDRANLQIRNGRLNGFYGAIWLIGDYCSTCTAGAWYNSANDIIENMRISNSYYVAVYMNKVGPFRLENNDIDIVHGFGTTNGGSALVYGLYVLNAGEGAIRRNHVTINAPGNTDVNSTGVYVNGTPTLSNLFVIDNYVANCQTGFRTSTYSPTQTKLRDNLTSAVTTPISGGVDLGGNN